MQKAQMKQSKTLPLQSLRCLLENVLNDYLDVSAPLDYWAALMSLFLCYLAV